MPEYKLTYFNIKGLAEPLRFLLSYGGLDFEDNRIERADWPALKATMPMGQMPVLEIDGKQVYQSIAIARYLAKEVGLSGADAWEDLQIDIVIDTFTDMRHKLTGATQEQNEEAKAKKMETLLSEQLPFYLDKFEEMAKENNGYLALGKLTWADVYVASLVDCLGAFVKTNLLENRPNLQKVIDNVLEIEQIKNWVEKRPVTDF